MPKIQLRAYVLAVILGLTLLMVRSARPLAMEGRPKTDFSRIPMDIDGWSGLNGRFDESTYKGLPSCSLLVRFYQHPDHPTVDLAVVYGTDLGDFHQPEFCLEGQGLQIVDKHKIMIRTNEGTFPAVSLITDSDMGRRAFIFWFAGNGSASTFLGNYKVKLFFHRLRFRTIQPSAMIRLSTEVVETDQEASNRLVQFIKLAYPYLRQEFEVDSPGS
ncbi:MAG TPA: EpsI family protein [Armatimonadota bacterium]|nr:EpsI family protein [Armatimonadota bacterium]